MKKLNAALTIALLGLAGCAPEARVIESPLVERLEKGQTTSAETFDHSDWDALLRSTALPAESKVRYSLFVERRAELDRYLARIAEANVTKLGRDEQMALLINAYNAYTVLLILEHYPNLTSIKDINNPWKTKRYKVGGETLSLDDIEHGLLRPIFKDPRIHFAVNCAAIGCPPLADFAFTGGELESQLNKVTVDALQNDAYVRVSEGKLELTSILDWYGSDFTDASFKGNQESVAAYIADYAKPDVAQFIRAKSPSVKFIDYDWRLNETP